MSEVLLDLPLVADPDAEQELARKTGPVLTDADIRGSRLLLVRRRIQPIHIAGQRGAMVEMACTFQASAGHRFEHARVVLQLISPEETRFADVGPAEIRDDEPVKCTVDQSGKLSFKQIVEAQADFKDRKEYLLYRCLLTGSGAGTRLARWEFLESPDRKEGLPPEQQLFVTLPGSGRISATVTLSARLVRPGLGGAMDSLRDLVLGGHERFAPVAFQL